MHTTQDTVDKRHLRILVIEDNEDDAFLLLQRFRDADYKVHAEQVWDDLGLNRALDESTWDCILSDHSMPQFNAISALNILQQRGLDIPFVIVSGVIEEDLAITAMRAGASDYLSKERLDRLVPAMERELREARNREERRQALERVRENEARFRALAANLPGMVFQLTRTDASHLQFTYVSEGCAALLGVRPSELIASPNLLTDMMFTEDRLVFERTIAEASQNRAVLNWEGQIRLQGHATKWINVRSSPRELESGQLVWEGIVSNITHSKQVEQELRESHEQLADLSEHLQIAKEEERERIARDIHDELGGTLVAIKIETALLSTKPPEDPHTLRKRVRNVEKMIDDAIAIAGRVARELRPGILKDFGLGAAIECQAEDFTLRTGIPCRILCANHDLEPEENTAIAFFRIFQEALTNITKHAKATTVDVLFYEDNGEMVLDVTDNGCGMQALDMSKPKSFGLRGIRERISSLGGNTIIEPASPHGTHLHVRVPLLLDTNDEPTIHEDLQGQLFPESGE